MIEQLISFSLRNRVLVLLVAAGLLVLGRVFGAGQ